MNAPHPGRARVRGARQNNPGAWPAWPAPIVAQCFCAEIGSPKSSKPSPLKRCNINVLKGE